MRVMWFCIPAFGHTNPTIEVVRELVCRGHEVRYYSFGDFRERIEGTGATFVPCDQHLPPLSAQAERRLRKVSTTEMSILSLKTCELMDEQLTADVASLAPDVVVSDSACFWGKLTAAKHGLPLVVSTTTFAFNQASSQYMHYSAAELADMVLGLPRVNRALRSLRKKGYRVKGALDIVQSKPDDNAIVYTSRRFQPAAETFGDNYCFVGPSVRPVAPQPRPADARPLVYVSLGTVINDHPALFRHCIDAVRNEEFDLLISCGRAFDPATLGKLPNNVQVEQYVDQLDVLSRASLFITHCGMNSASEGLYLGVPELLYPITGEQRAVARRVEEMGAGHLLGEREAASAGGIRAAIRSAASDDALRTAAQAMREDFLSCGGPTAAADFVEQVASASR